MKKLEMKKILVSAVAAVVLASGVGLQSVNAMEMVSENTNYLKPIITSRPSNVVEADKDTKKISLDSLDVDEMNPIITSRNFVKEEVKNDKNILNRTAESEIMSPIITSRDFVKKEVKMDIKTIAANFDEMNPIITSETILSHK